MSRENSPRRRGNRGEALGTSSDLAAPPSDAAQVSSLPVHRIALEAAPVVSGVLIAASFLHFSLWPLAWIAFVPLLWTLGSVTTRRDALRVGLVAGMATNVPAFYWLVYTISVFGGFPWPVAVFFYLCLSVYSAGQFVLLTLGLHRTGIGPLAVAAPVLWVALEFLYPNLFPWRMANTQFHVPVLTQIGDLTGPFGLSFVIIWMQAALIVALTQRRRAPLLASLVCAAAVTAYGAIRMPAVQGAIDAAPVVRVGLVQGNVGIFEKGNVAMFDINVNRYRRLTETLQVQVDLIVWPESVIQEWVPMGAQLVPAEAHPFPGLRKPLVYGGLGYEPGSGDDYFKYNEAFLIAPDGRILGRYQKQILLPFGEFLPGASLIPSLKNLSPQTGDFTPGSRNATLDLPGVVRIGPLVCYEDVPARIARAMTAAGAELLVTMFNDAWFGRSAAPYQHEALALWRAIENRRYFVRVGNAGVSDVIDPFGRVVSRLGMFTEETLVAQIRPLNIQTIYTRFGDWFGWTITLAAVVLIAVREKR